MGGALTGGWRGGRGSYTWVERWAGLSQVGGEVGGAYMRGCRGGSGGSWEVGGVRSGVLLRCIVGVEVGGWVEWARLLRLMWGSQGWVWRGDGVWVLTWVWGSGRVWPYLSLTYG